MGASMASSPPALVIVLCALLCICCLQTSGVTAARATPKPETIELTYHLLEIRGGPGTNGTIFAAAGTGTGGTNSSTQTVGWGTYFVFDSPLQEGPTMDSKAVGKSTGIASVISKGGILEGGVQINCQHVYGDTSQYPHSSITVQGIVNFTTPSTAPWECIVPGGTGYFRGYRGYGLASLETDFLAPQIIYKWRIYLSK